MNLKLQLRLDSPAEEYIVESKNGWRLLTRNGAIEIKPLVDYDGEPLTELPVFDRADIFPVPPEPDFAKLYPKEAQKLRRSHQLWARKNHQPNPSPDRERRDTNIELERKHGTPSDYPRGLLTEWDILALNLRHQDRDRADLLQRIRYRAEFWHGENSLGVYLSACGVDVLTLEERSILPSCIEAPKATSAHPATTAQPHVSGTATKEELAAIWERFATIPMSKGKLTEPSTAVREIVASLFLLHRNEVSRNALCGAVLRFRQLHGQNEHYKLPDTYSPAKALKNSTTGKLLLDRGVIKYTRRAGEQRSVYSLHLPTL